MTVGPVSIDHSTDELSMPVGESARPGQWRTLPASVWAPGSVDLAGTSAPPVGWQTGSVGIPDRGWYLRTGELVDVGEGPDIFYNPLGTEQRYEDGRMIIQTRAAAVGAWNPRTSEERPFHWSETEPSKQLGQVEDRPLRWPGLVLKISPETHQTSMAALPAASYARTSARSSFFSRPRSAAAALSSPESAR